MATGHHFTTLADKASNRHKIATKGGKANAIIVTLCALPDPAVFSFQVVCYGVAEKTQGVNKKEQLGGMGIW